MTPPSPHACAWALLPIVLAVACDSPALTGGPPAPAARAGLRGEDGVVTVTFVDAVVALSHLDGVAWDSGHIVPELTRADLRVALVGPDAYGRVLERIAARDAEPWGKPDPVGHITLMGSASCRTETRLLPLQRDTYRPSWAPGIVWAHVPFDRGTRFRVVLEDDDAPAQRELIGAVDITHASLDAALARSGAVHRVDVSDQKQPILFIGIRVVRD